MTPPNGKATAHHQTPVAELTAALADRYVIERELGRGGMATVFLARDLKHARDVAIKLLDPELGAVLGAERFLSEIRTTASLQHPNLLPLFDSGEVSGLLYYVMPYVSGETLRARLHREKQLPVDEAVRLASAVASALAYAHGRGVIHRDLKPENILLQAGQPVVADFGIALAVSNAGGARVTQTGLSLGTPQYMSPEQATGDRVLDARSDVYALGAVCYEMLTGEPPHTGSTAQAIIARLLTEQPRAPRDVRPAVPAHVDAAVRRALQKLPADRFANAQAFADALEGRGQVPTEPTPSAAAPRGRIARLFSSPLWAVACLAAIASTAWLAQRPTPPPLRARFKIPLEEAERLSSFDSRALAIAPDGGAIAFVGATATNGVLYVRRLDELKPRLLPGTDGVRAPFFSPDGKWIAFVARGRLRKVPVDGGAVVEITDGTALPDFTGATWTPGGEILFTVPNDQTFRNAGLLRVSAAGGAIRTFTQSTNGVVHEAPIVAPDGKSIVFVAVTGRIRSGAQSKIAIASEDGTFTVLELPADRPLGFVDDRLVYLRGDGTLMAVSIDVAARKVTGEPTLLLESVRSPVLSASGSLLYSPGQAALNAVLVDDRGVSTPLLSEARQYAHPRFSPDGKRIAFDIGGTQGRAIWLYEIASATLTRLTSVGSNVRPEWSPDGQRVIYRQIAPGKGLWWQPADGSGVPEQLVEVPGGPNEGMLSPDGRTLMYRTDEGTGDQQVFTVPIDKSAKPTALLTKNVNWAPRFSPDGRWIAYSSDESGEAEVYVRPWPGAGGRVQVSSGGGSEPVWARDGRALFYRQNDAVVAASVAADGPFTVLARRRLISGAYETAGPHASYDVTPDGKRLLMLQATDDRAPVVLVLNWAQDVRAQISAR